VASSCLKVWNEVGKRWIEQEARDYVSGYWEGEGDKRWVVGLIISAFPRGLERKTG
jgi:hypothetical protein